MNNFTNEEIIDILESSNTQREAILNLKYKINGSGFRYLNKICLSLDFDIKKITFGESKDEYNKNPKLCKNCDCIIEWKNKRNDFCSHSCAASYNNLGNNRNKRKFIYYSECQNCGEKFENEKLSKFCDVSCCNDKLYKDYIMDWKLNIINGRSGLYQISNYIRKYLHIKNNNKCEKCGWGERNVTTNKIPLEIHHIDGDCTNNIEANLELLCPNCHSLTNNFGSLNKNSKREFRKLKNLKDT